MNNWYRCLFLFILFAVAAFPVSNKLELSFLRTETLTVEVKGEAESCGIYELPAGSSVSDLLELSGTTDQADLTAFNLMTVLKDGDVLNIPAKPEEARISINTASKEQLMKIPGIGEVMAERIIAYRSEYGLFQRIEDLMKVKGIGQKKLDRMKDHVCL